MNQVDKELLISKRFMNEEEQINVKQIELEAMMEATIFAGAIMENSMDVDILLAISQKIMHLDCNNQQLQIHLLVQRLFKDSRARGELDSFYVASLHGETLKTYGEYDFPVEEMVSICEEWLQEFCDQMPLESQRKKYRKVFEIDEE